MVLDQVEVHVLEESRPLHFEMMMKGVFVFSLMSTRRIPWHPGAECNDGAYEAFLPYIEENDGMSCTMLTLNIPCHRNQIRMDRWPVRHKVAVPWNITPFTLDSQRRHYTEGDVVFVPYCYPTMVCPVIFFKATVAHHQSMTHVNVSFHCSHELFLVRVSCLYLANWKELHTKCHGAVLAWILCAKKGRLVVRDLARLIGQWVWTTKNEAEWEVKV